MGEMVKWVRWSTEIVSLFPIKSTPVVIAQYVVSVLKMLFPFIELVKN